MSVVIPLQPIPNQSFPITLDGNNFDLKFQAISEECMAVTIVRNDVRLISGHRVVAGMPLLPYRYLETGNFIFISETQNIPFYTEFGLTQTLLYFSQSELDTIRGDT